MPLRNRVGASGGGNENGVKIKGDVVSRTVASGSVATGDFVEYVSDTTVKRFVYSTSGNQAIIGVAKTGGSANSSIQVYIP